MKVKHKQVIGLFIVSSGILLFLTAIAKLISAGGSARILQEPDPILTFKYYHVFWIVGLFELAAALICIFGKKIELQAGLVALLATNFVFYRLGLIWVGYRRPCKCFGNLTDALHIPPQTADTAMKIILAYLLIGSYATLFWLWRQKRKVSSSALSAEPSV